MKEIAIIIPTYKAHETIERTLQSIAIQTLKDKAKVYISVDADGENYDYLLAFKKYFDIEILYAKKNGGPGVARQFAIDRSTEPYLVFIDADDTFSGAFALNYLYALISQDDVCMGRALMEEQNIDGQILAHTHDMVWLHGKIYKRSFMEKYKIRFTKLRANEDVGFNRLFKLLKGKNRIPSLDKIVYTWHYQANSIVRKNNHEYEFSGSIEGAVTNTIETVNHALKYEHAREEAYFLILEQMFNNYIYYLRVLEYAPQQKEFATDHFKRYYKEAYKKLPQEFIAQYEKKVGSKAIQELAAEWQDFIPHVSYYDFKELVK